MKSLGKLFMYTVYAIFGLFVVMTPTLRAIVIWSYIILLILFDVGLLCLFFIMDKRDKGVSKYLEECKKKCENGEMSKLKYEQIYTYWVLDPDNIC